MNRSIIRKGQQPLLWLVLFVPLRKFYKFRYIAFLFVFLILIICLRLLHRLPSDPLSPSITSRTFVIADLGETLFHNCTSNPSDSLLRDVSPDLAFDPQDSRPRPTLQRLEILFDKLISYEEKFKEIFQSLGIFRFTDFDRSLRPFANHLERFEQISCLFKRFINISESNGISISASLLVDLKKISTYLADGFHHPHSTWNDNSIDSRDKPVIVLAANSRFYDTFQASMRTVDKHLFDFKVAVYDLGFSDEQIKIIKENCQRCLIIPFPFDLIEPLAPHIRNLANFAWKPIVVQDALQRFGSIIYGDTSIRYASSNFDRLLIDNRLRGFSCRELPGHYLPCFTMSDTFQWFNESSSDFEEVYIAEAGFLAVIDNFLSRLILKSWVTCALDRQCIVPLNSRTACQRMKSSSMSTHRYDQSAMVTILSFFFFPSARQGEKTDPAPYDMYASIQKQIAEVRRFEGDNNYFTRKHA